ncbi:uncharacterized protein LOC119362224 isoform X2 [Triticum dicoccoides]|uniref:uncharacterized protein LOC119362224 isoform X2 n=1 Tax=Triticum dicoccoides TaxID=85692 RepID=UPI00188E2552|nr:uncharacterized protein LOC119362224 isoform X2 [Triticum dicoccoides]
MTAVVSPPILPVAEGAPSWVLLDTAGYIAKRGNATFAKTLGSNGQPVEVTFCTAAPPHVSHFCVHCPGLVPADFVEDPTLIGAEADLVLFRLCVDPLAVAGERLFDYFLYTAHPRRPSLQLLPHPYPNLFHDSEVALLRCGEDDEYAIAALRNIDDYFTDEPQMSFNLYLYRSSRAGEGWTARVVSVEEPLRDTVCPVEEPKRFHETTKAITLGGGAVGWVDLWRGILVCNVFDEKPVLRDVPLLLPARGNWEIYHRCGPYFARDITVSPQKDVIKYVEVEICLPRKPTTTKTTETCHPPEPESYLEWFRQQQCEDDDDDDDDDEDVGGWKATTWSLPVPIASRENWHFDYTVDVDDLTVVDPMHCKLLPRPLQPTEAEALLPRLITAFPIMSMDDDVVYLLSKASPKDQMEVVIAVDMRRKFLQGVAKLVTGKDFTFMRSCISEISKYINYKSSGDVAKASASLSAASRRAADKETEEVRLLAKEIPSLLLELELLGLEHQTKRSTRVDMCSAEILCQWQQNICSLIFRRLEARRRTALTCKQAGSLLSMPHIVSQRKEALHSKS